VAAIVLVRIGGRRRSGPGAQIKGELGLPALTCPLPLFLHRRGSDDIRAVVESRQRYICKLSSMSQPATRYVTCTTGTRIIQRSGKTLSRDWLPEGRRS